MGLEFITRYTVELWCDDCVVATFLHVPERLEPVRDTCDAAKRSGWKRRRTTEFISNAGTSRIGAVLGAAPGLLKDALAALRERRAIRAHLAFLLRELDERLDAPRAAITEAGAALQARLLDDHWGNATQHQQNAVFEA